MSTNLDSPLAQELAYYDSHKLEWLNAHLGEFALVGSNTVAGFFPTYEAALEAGVKAFGLSTNFLIKQVSEQEPVFVIY